MNRPVLGFITAGAVLIIGVGVGLWALIVLPNQRLPRPAAAIEADWARLAPERAFQSRTNPLASHVFHLDSEPSEVSQPSIDALLNALRDGLRTPVTCNMLEGMGDLPSDPTPSQVLHAGRALIHHGELDAATLLAHDLLDGDLVSFGFGAALIDEIDKIRPTKRPTTHDFQLAMMREAYCGDQVLARFVEDNVSRDNRIPGLRTPFFDFRIARLRYRDRMAVELRAIENAQDVSSLKAALSQLPPVDSQFALTRVMTAKSWRMLDLLDPPP